MLMTTDTIRPARPRIAYWKVALPVVLAGILIAAAAIVMTVLLSANGAEPERVSIIGDLLLICFGLCPLVLCSGIIYALLVASIYGVNRMHMRTERTLRRARTMTRALADKTATMSDTIGQKSIDASAQFAILDQWLDNPVSGTSETEEESHGNDTGREST